MAFTPDFKTLISENNIGAIYIMMGWRCNFNCRYCLQTPSATQGEELAEPTEEVYRYIDHLLEIRPDFSVPLKIRFWGGEPLVYESVIRKTIARLGGRPDYGIVTNGSLLTPDFVDFANVESIKVMLSNDGEASSLTRRVNMLENPEFCRLFYSVDHRGVESVLTAYSYDFERIYEYVNARVPHTPVHIDPLRFSWDIPADIIDIPEQPYSDALIRSANRYLDGLYKESKDIPEWGLFGNIMAKGPKGTGQVCNSGVSTLNIDLRGNIYMCHNGGGQIGHIHDERIDLVRKFTHKVSERRKMCEGCEVEDQCNGVCMMEQDVKLIEKSCRLRKIFYAVRRAMHDAYTQTFSDIEL